MKARQMALTAGLVARVHRVVEDVGQEPGLSYQTDEDYEAAVAKILATRPAGEDAWLFAYGSLIWKPEIEQIDARRGTARGFHRSFCFRIVRHRATKDQPGLMMALDRGGQCQGGSLSATRRNPAGATREAVPARVHSEAPETIPRWISVDTDQGTVRALAFVMNRDAPTYAGRLPPAEVADILAKACGHWGSGADYLCNTVAHLEEHGIRDRNL